MAESEDKGYIEIKGEKQDTIKRKRRTKKKKNVSTKSYIYWGIAFIAIIVLAFLLRGRQPQEPAYAAKVNNNIITQADINKLSSILPTEIRGFYSDAAILDQIINEKLLLDEAAKRGINVSDAEVEDTFNKLAYSIPANTSIEDVLAKRGLTVDDAKEMIRKQVILSKLTAQLSQGINVSDAEVEEYYANNSDKLGNVTLDEIRTQIRGFLKQQKEGEMLSSFIEGLKRHAAIDIRLKGYYSYCASKMGVKKEFAFYYSDNCYICLEMKKSLDKLGVDYYGIETSTGKGGKLYDNCLSSIGVEVPQLVCLNNGQVLKGWVKDSSKLGTFINECKQAGMKA